MPDLDAPDAARSDLESWRRRAAANAFDHDPFLGRLLQRYLGAGAEEVKRHLSDVAEQAGAGLAGWVDTCNRDENLPRLRHQDTFGRSIQEVVFHPAHHDIGRAFWRSRVLSILESPETEIPAGAIAYLLDQHGEAGHACPVACTAGAIKLVQRLGSEDQKARYLPGLLSSDYDRRLHAAQFVTEIQGGSDVGANACRAVAVADRPGHYRISGEKWFCSVADAGLFVVSARVDGAADGTPGLGLFLVPRTVDGHINGFRLRRLKSKLGTRSMPTGEIEFEGALGEAIGPIDHGFKNLVAIVLDTSRVHNAIAACGIMRRAFREAHAYASWRRAFGQPIADFAGVRSILARMKLRSMAGLASTFRILDMSDRLETGRENTELEAARRIAVMLNKYWTSVASSRSSRDGIEILGGNGTIEDFSVLPRLYRDAIVIESWEGTHNTLCAQVLRDFAVRGLHRPWLDQLEREMETLVQPGLAAVSERARELREDVDERIERLLSADDETANATMRTVVDHMCRLTDWVALAGQVQWEMAANAGDSETHRALELYRLLALDAVDPQDTPELQRLESAFAANL